MRKNEEEKYVCMHVCICSIYKGTETDRRERRLKRENVLQSLGKIKKTKEKEHLPLFLPYLKERQGKQVRNGGRTKHRECEMFSCTF